VDALANEGVAPVSVEGEGKRVGEEEGEGGKDREEDVEDRREGEDCGLALPESLRVASTTGMVGVGFIGEVEVEADATPP
jgi:hypothetical protein